MKIEKDIKIPNEFILDNNIKPNSTKRIVLNIMQKMVKGDSILVTHNNQNRDNYRAININTVKNWLREYHTKNNILVPYKDCFGETKYRVDCENLHYVCKAEYKGTYKAQVGIFEEEKTIEEFPLFVGVRIWKIV